MPVVPIDEDDLNRRAAVAVAAALPGATLSPLARLQGGTSSITYRAALAGAASSPDEVVLKVAPAGAAPTKNVFPVEKRASLVVSTQTTQLFAIAGIAVTSTIAAANPYLKKLFIRQSSSNILWASSSGYNGAKALDGSRGAQEL